MWGECRYVIVNSASQSPQTWNPNLSDGTWSSHWSQEAFRDSSRAYDPFVSRRVGYQWNDSVLSACWMVIDNFIASVSGIRSVCACVYLYVQLTFASLSSCLALYYSCFSLFRTSFFWFFIPFSVSQTPWNNDFWDQWLWVINSEEE